jgi:hypothetical protein
MNNFHFKLSTEESLKKGLNKIENFHDLLRRVLVNVLCYRGHVLN